LANNFFIHQRVKTIIPTALEKVGNTWKTFIGRLEIGREVVRTRLTSMELCYREVADPATRTQSVNVSEDIGGAADVAVVAFDTSAVLPHATVAGGEH